jgi:hypothetical protein
MEPVFWIIAAVSTTICLSKAAIFERPKKMIISSVTSKFGIDIIIGELLYCSQCLGFWVGVFGFMIHPYSVVNPFMNKLFLNAIITGFMVSTLSILIDRMIYGRYENTDED